MIDELIQRLPRLSGEEIERLEAGLSRERERRAADQEPTTPKPVTEVLEYRPHEDGHLQLELRRYVRRDGSTRERGPYWYFSYHEGGKRKKLYLGKTNNPEERLAELRAQ